MEFLQYNLIEINPIMNISKFRSGVTGFLRIINKSIQKGYLTKMWNLAFKEAYNDNCDYFFQCGDDIEFKTDNWVNDCIDVLQKVDNVGLTGPINNNQYILTQSFVSRKHMDIFGYYFPEEIINWFCDDWYNGVYKKMNAFYPLQNHYCANIGGYPRYDINNEKYNSNEHFRKRREDQGVER